MRRLAVERLYVVAIALLVAIASILMVIRGQPAAERLFQAFHLD